MSDSHHHHHKQKSESKAPASAGVYTGHEDTPLLGKDGEKSSSGSHKIRNILFIVIFVVVVLAIGMGAIFLTLPGTYTCNPNEASYYSTLVMPPQVAKADPPVVCAAHHTPIVLLGNNFIALDNNTLPNLTVSLNGTSVKVKDVDIRDLNVSECNSLHIRRRDYQTCKELGMVASFPVDPTLQAYSVVFDIASPVPPQPAIGKNENSSCTVQAMVLTVIPSPTVSSVNPGFICRGDDNSITIDGTYFVQARKTGSSAESVPSFSICDDAPKTVSQITDCTDMPKAAGYDYIRSCKSLVVETSAASCNPNSVQALSLTNPEPGSCPAEYPDGLKIPITDRPSITSVDKTLICAVDGAVNTSLDVVGSGFVMVNGKTPIVSFNNETSTGISPKDCTEYSVGSINVTICNHLTVAVPSYTPASIEGITLNVASSLSTCGSVFENLVYYAPVPVIDNVEPAYLCHSSNAQNVTLEGSFVVDKNNQQIQVMIGDVTSPNVYLEECSESTVGSLSILSCTKLLFEVPSDTPFGPLPITVISACSASLDKNRFVHIPVPNVTQMSQNTLCASSLNEIQVTGENFVAIGNSTPHVVFAGNVEAESVAVDDCTGDDDFRVCNKLSFTINGAQLNGTKTTFTISNSDSLCGGSQVVATLPVAGVPVVESYDKDMCEGGGVIKVTGSGFRADALEFLLKSDNVTVQAKLSDITETSFVANFAAGTIDAGVYSVIIRSAPQAECTASVTSTVRVNDNELAVIDINPPLIVVPGGRAQTVVLTTRAFVAVPVYINLVSEKLDLIYTNDNITVVDSDYDRFFLTLPNNLEAGQSFNITMRAQTTCMASADNILKVTDKKTGDLATVVPSVVSSQVSTFITISVASSAFTKDDIISVMAASTDNVYELDDVAVVSDTSVTARVVAGLLKNGNYMIYVTKANTGEYWSKDSVLTINGLIPPSISSITPSLLPVTENTQLTINGANFATTAKFGVSLHCTGNVVIKAKEASAASDTKLSVVLPEIPSNADHTSCLVTVEDQTNNYVVDFNGISISSDDKRPGCKMEDKYLLPTPLCGLSAVSTTIGDHSFIYVIGGDSDKDCQGKAPVSSVMFGEIDNDKEDTSLLNSYGWRSTSSLPFAVAFAQVQVIDTFVYVIGGFDRSSARDTVLRAQVLQPSNAPVVTGVMHASVDGKLPVGHYLYAVTASYKSDDSINPNGQSLPSNVVSMYVSKVSATPFLKWNKIDDDSITSYRVYRANLKDGKYVNIANVTGTEYQDLGTSSTTAGEPPALGSLGNWATLSQSMSVARCGHASTTLNALGATGVHYLFSFGGSSSPLPTSEAFDTYESAKITMTAEIPGGKRQSHVFNSWNNGTTSMNGQHLWSGVMLDNTNVGYSQYQAVVLGPGAENMHEHQLNYAQNNDVFVLNPFNVTNINSVNSFGYCMYVHDHSLVMIGGSPSKDKLEASKTISVMKLNTAEPPNPLTNYAQSNDCTVQLAVVYAGYTRVAGYLVVVGGLSAGTLTPYMQFLPG